MTLTPARRRHGVANAPPAEPAAVLRCAWHLAVLAGPGAGACLGLEPGRSSVGRADVGDDPLVSAGHLEVRLRRGRVEARDAGSANGTRVRRAARRWPGTWLLPPWRRARRPWASRQAPQGPPRRLGATWRALGDGDVLEIGATHLQLRPRPARAVRPGPPPDVRDRTAGHRRDAGRLLLPGLMSLTTVPLVLTSSAGPWRWLLLLVPLALTWSAVRPVGGSTPGPLPDPGAVLLRAGAGPPAGTAVAGGTGPGDHLLVPVSVDPGGARRPRHVPGPLDLSDGPVALVGPRTVVEPVARWLVCQLAVHHPPGELALELPDSWRWAAGLPHRRTAATPGDRAAAAPEGVTRLRVAVARPGLAPSPGLVLAEDVADVPPWCPRVVDLPCAPRGLPGPRWSAAVARALATDGPRAAAVPRVVALADLLGLGRSGPDVAGGMAGRLGASWDRSSAGLTAPIGVGSDGVVDLDLAADGPHALVAGSTGAGKSELLLSWLTALAVRYSPAALQVVLVDYKGGATFAPLAGLPHTAGVLTDLDPAGTERALSSLRAEVRRRETLLAGAGAPDLTSYTAAGNRLARLLVVVDEFRVLAEAHPAVLSALVRLAAQGRSLGIHLVLATQRPGGAVGPEVRANLGVRLCLRVLEPADSVDVVGTPRAAGLDPVPGRALLRTDRLREIQVPWAGPPSGGLVGEVVAGAALAWGRRSTAVAATPPWAPPLPSRVRLDTVVRADARATRTETVPGAPGEPTGPRRTTLTLPLARTDLPDEQRLGTWSWSGPALLVTGGPGTGRTQTLRTVAASARAAGVPVHVVAADLTAFDDVHEPGVGSLVPTGDPRLVARLLDLLAHAADGTTQVLLVDDADDVAESLDLTGPGRGTALLGAAVRGARRSGVAVALTGPPSLAGARWLEAVRTRVVLSPRDETEALLCGVPASLRARGGPPGRGVLLRPEGAVHLQVAQAPPAPTPPARAPRRPPAGVPLVRPLPPLVRLAEAPVGGGVVLGRGGDDAGWVTLGCAPGARVLVVGPPGSGRSTALDVLARQLRRTGRQVVTDPARARPGDVVVADDLDPLAAEALPDLSGVTVLAAARTEAAATAYRGPLVTWRAGADLVLLRPAHPLTGQVTDVDVRPAVDPVRPHHPGLAVLVRAGRALPVQVATP